MFSFLNFSKKIPSNHSTKKTDNKLIKDIDPRNPDENDWFPIGESHQWLNIHSHIVKTISSLTRLSEIQNQTYYIKAIENFACLCQALPASEYHHHSFHGGLLQHSLETAFFAVKFSKNYLFSESGTETEFEQSYDVFCYACFLASLIHDAGKIITDFDIVIKNKNNEVSIFNPLIQNYNITDKYKFRFSKFRKGNLHTYASLMLITKIIPPQGMFWLSKNKVIFNNFLLACSGKYEQADILGKVLQQSDHASVNESFDKTSKPNFNTKIGNRPTTLAEFYLVAIRQIIESGTVSINVAGAGFWVKEDHVYCVSKRIVSAATPLVKSLGFNKIPNTDMLIFSQLCDAGVAERHPITNDVIHTIHVSVQEPKSWSSTLTFLKIPKITLDPNNSLGLCSGNFYMEDLTEKGDAKKENSEVFSIKLDEENIEHLDNFDLSPSFHRSSKNNLNIPKVDFSDIDATSSLNQKKEMVNLSEIIKVEQTEAPAIVTEPASQQDDYNIDEFLVTGTKGEQTEAPAIVTEPASQQDDYDIDEFLVTGTKGEQTEAPAIVTEPASQQDQNAERDNECSSGEFIQWLNENISNNTIKYNRDNANCIVRHTTDGWFLFFPQIIDLYKKSNYIADIDSDKLILNLKKERLLKTGLNGICIRTANIKSQNKNLAFEFDGLLLKENAIKTSKTATLIRQDLFTILN